MIVVGKEPSVRSTGGGDEIHGNTKFFSQIFTFFLFQTSFSYKNLIIPPMQSLKKCSDVNTFKTMSAYGDRKYTSDEWSSNSSPNQRQQVTFEVSVV